MARMTGLKDASGEPPPIDLDQYVPAYLTWIANKLSRGASQHYLRLFGVGIEAWRCMVLLATEGAASAQLISRVTGMDKSSVSRCLKSMQDAKLIKTALDPHDGRARLASLTAKGQAMHDEIRAIALERERSLLSVLSKPEQAELLRLLRLVHENLPAVEEDTSAFIDKKYANRPPGGKRPSERPG
jgi:DNA-binding MarR family transcriptional regulator